MCLVHRRQTSLDSHSRFFTATVAQRVWLNDLVTAATADLRRTQCANAAAARPRHPQVNLLGLGDMEGASRRAKCLEAAMILHSQRKSYIHVRIKALRRGTLGTTMPRTLLACHHTPLGTTSSSVWSFDPPSSRPAKLCPRTLQDRGQSR